MAAKKRLTGNIPEMNEERDESFSDEELRLSDDEEGGTRVGDIYIPPPVKPYCSTESKGPRLIIKKIVNINFKSYAGEVVLGPFHHNFTAIIGPNGSGKSNVIDSLLFVFGYRAQKIRCKKLSVLLHNSSKNHNVQMCSVAVHFEEIIDKPNGEIEEIPNSTFVISRTAFKDNTSFYAINDKKAQFKEVAKLLEKHGVDLAHNRFLILQGEVESIAMMKSKAQNENDCGMLEYLEDIIGTTRYKNPLKKINIKVEDLTEIRTQKHNRCKYAEREMKDLEQPFNEAIEYLEMENTLTRTTNLKIQKYLSEQNKQLQEFLVEQESIKNELKTHDEKYDEIKKEKKKKEEVIKEEIARFEQMCTEKTNMEKDLNTAQDKFTEVQSTMRATNDRRKQNKTQVEKNIKLLDDLKKLPEKKIKEILECEKKVEGLSITKKELEATLQKNYALLEKQTKPLIEKRDKLETKLANLKNISDEAKSELLLVESEINILKHDETLEKRKYESLKSSYEESNDCFQENVKKLKEINEEIPQVKNEINKKTNEIHKLVAEEKDLRNKLMTLKADISEKTSNMQAFTSNNKVLSSLMRQKQEGNIPGILGRLGDLGAIDAKYDVAISTACGRLDNIIVDTVNTAQACIEHLKRHDVGRASFIALEKVEHLRQYCEKMRNTPENVPRLFDLIRVEDQRVLPAFYFSLRNTMVANDLDQGTRIGYGATRYRVVTLKGDVIETSGTMSGGGRTQLRGKMGQKVAVKSVFSPNTSIKSKNNLQDLQIKAEEIQSNINYCQEMQSKLEKEINQLKCSLQQKENEVKRLEITVKSLSDQLPRIKIQLQNQKERADKTNTDPAKVKDLEKKLKIKQQDFDKADKATSELAKDIANINKEISTVHNTTIKSIQEKLNGINKQINVLTANISKSNVEIKTSERNYQKTENEITELRNEIKLAEDTIKSLTVERTKYDLEGIELSKKIEEYKEQIEKASQESSHIKKEILALQKQESDGKLLRLEIDQKVQTLQKKISSGKDHITHWQNQLKPLKLNEIPGQLNPLEPLKIYTEEQLASYQLKDLQYQCTVQEQELQKKKPNLTVIEEYMNKRKVYLERVQALEDVTNKRNEMRHLYDDVRKKRFTEFIQGFQIITKKLKEMYQMITQGGDAELELVDSMDPFTEGISFSVRPPKKTWKNISNLSGGEKTLSSLALVFALHYYKPSPLYFMDEIDAALDFKNISIVAHYIKERTKNAQFIIISLRSNMFELSNYLVGIYKINDCTNSVTIENRAPEFLQESQVQHIITESCSNTLPNDTQNNIELNTSLMEVSNEIITQDIVPTPNSNTNVNAIISA